LWLLISKLIGNLNQIVIRGAQVDRKDWAIGSASFDRAFDNFNLRLYQMGLYFAERSVAQKTEIGRPWSRLCRLRFKLLVELMRVDLLRTEFQGFTPPGKFNQLHCQYSGMEIATEINIADNIADSQDKVI
jgi:hypothetical protein